MKHQQEREEILNFAEFQSIVDIMLPRRILFFSCRITFHTITRIRNEKWKTNEKPLHPSTWKNLPNTWTWAHFWVDFTSPLEKKTNWKIIIMMKKMENYSHTYISVEILYMKFLVLYFWRQTWSITDVKHKHWTSPTHDELAENQTIFAPNAKNIFNCWEDKKHYSIIRIWTKQKKNMDVVIFHQFCGNAIK